ncbi:ParA family protein [Anaeroselena agilis]|uniref:ParA family protein n=1 Tax=Anaeroselena agilis TaxID=3063788 RepID=A0ABU3P2I0_9FIRM|nr:ParA family protein [Selenomonadales bacterium 4137-cl]
MGNTKVVSVINWKGGVGKTTFTHHLGTGLQELSETNLSELLGTDTSPKVLLVDLDAQCNLSISCLSDDIFEKKVFTDKIGTIKDLFEKFLVDENANVDLSQYILKKSVRSSEGYIYTNVDLLVSHPDLIYTDMDIAVYAKPSFKANLMNKDIYKFRIVHNILKGVKDQYDFIFFDCPPNLNFITQNALYESDYYLIPTILDKLSSYGILSITHKVKDLNKAFSGSDANFHETNLAGIVSNNVREYSQEPKDSQSNVLTTLKNIFPNQVFENYLTNGDGIPKASASGYPVYAYKDKNANAKKQSEALINITKEFLARIK